MKTSKVVKWILIGAFLGLLVLYFSVTSEFVDEFSTLFGRNELLTLAIVMVISCGFIDLLIYLFSKGQMAQEKQNKLVAFSLSFLLIPPIIAYVLLSLPGAISIGI